MLETSAGRKCGSLGPAFSVVTGNTSCAGGDLTPFNEAQLPMQLAEMCL